MAYKEQQRKHQESLLGDKSIFRNAEAGVVYRKVSRPYILKSSEYNFYESIVPEAFDYFDRNSIQWWQLEQKGCDREKKPTGHMLSSQVSCINHLFPIHNNKDAVIGLLKTIDNEFIDVLDTRKIDTKKPDVSDTPVYISFEAVCAGDYLNEGKNPTRGANCTSVDALIVGKNAAGKIILVLIEWKYTESYSIPKQHRNINPKRLERYEDLIKESENLNYIDYDKCRLYYQEPFYQLMRQTIWGEKMVANGYAGSSGFIHVHIIPEGNLSLLKSSRYKYNIDGKTGSLTELWKKQLKKPELYVVKSPKELLANQPDDEWKRYLEKRYWQ